MVQTAQERRDPQTGPGTATLTSLQGRGRTRIGTYETYRRAQRAVDHLSDDGFDVSRVTIIGEGLRWEEQITGRYDAGRALLSGAVQGAFLGGFVTLLMFLVFAPVTTGGYLMLIAWGLLFGAFIGALLHVAMYATTRGERDFRSVAAMRAAAYHVEVDQALAGDAGLRLRNAGL